MTFFILWSYGSFLCHTLYLILGLVEVAIEILFIMQITKLFLYNCALEKDNVPNDIAEISLLFLLVFYCLLVFFFFPSLVWDLFCLKVSQSWTKILCKIMFFLFKFVFYVMNVIRVSWNLLIWLIGQGVSLIWWGCDLIFTEFIFYISRLESICPTILMIYLWVMIATALLYIICAQMISHMVLL